MFVIGFVGGFLFALLFFLMRVFAEQEYISDMEKGYDSLNGRYTDFDTYQYAHYRDETTNE